MVGWRSVLDHVLMFNQSWWVTRNVNRNIFSWYVLIFSIGQDDLPKYAPWYKEIVASTIQIIGSEKLSTSNLMIQMIKILLDLSLPPLPDSTCSGTLCILMVLIIFPPWSERDHRDRISLTAQNNILPENLLIFIICTHIQYPKKHFYPYLRTNHNILMKYNFTKIWMIS